MIKKTYMFFKIPVLNKVAPGRLVISYAAGQNIPGTKPTTKLQYRQQQNRKPIDLRLFYSCSDREKEPNDSSFNKVYNNPKVVNLATPPGSDQYLTDFVYFSLFSTSGCSITLTAHFKDDPQQSLVHGLAHKSNTNAGEE